MHAAWLQELHELISARGWQFDLWSRHPFCATKSVADRLQAPMFEVSPVLCRWAVTDANGACSDAKLFICSPHSCEVVKTRFFHALLKTWTSKKGCPGLAPCPQRQNNAVAERMTALQIREKRGFAGRTGKRANFTRSVWAALCGRFWWRMQGIAGVAGPDQETSL